jgi:hypothetical protein
MLDLLDFSFIHGVCRCKPFVVAHTVCEFRTVLELHSLTPWKM